MASFSHYAVQDETHKVSEFGDPDKTYLEIVITGEFGDDGKYTTNVTDSLKAGLRTIVAGWDAQDRRKSEVGWCVECGEERGAECHDDAFPLKYHDFVSGSDLLDNTVSADTDPAD